MRVTEERQKVNGPHRRSVLAGLLWSEQDESSATRSLRRALWNLRDALGGDSNDCPYLRITRHDVAFNPESPHWLDVAAPSTDLPPLAGQPDAALAQYEQCARALRDKLGTAPLPETVRLYQRILRREIDAADAPHDDLLRQARTEPAFYPMPFAGREHDHAWLLSRW